MTDKEDSNNGVLGAIVKGLSSHFPLKNMSWLHPDGHQLIGVEEINVDLQPFGAEATRAKATSIAL